MGCHEKSPMTADITAGILLKVLLLAMLALLYLLLVIVPLWGQANTHLPAQSCRMVY
jgi:hypothetical protein